MRVAIINVTAMSGSTGKIAYGMYCSLKADGHDVRLYYGRNDDLTNDEICKVTPKASVYVHGLMARLTGLQGYYSIGATRKLILNLEQFSPDLVQLYNLHGYYLNVNMLLEYLKKKGIPTVYAMLDEYPYLGRCCYSFDCDQFQTGCLHCRQDRKEYPATILLRGSRKTLLDKQKSYDGFERLYFTAPQWVLDRAESSYLLKGKRMYCVDEYVDTDTTFYPRSFERGEYHRLPEELIQWRREGKKLVLTVAPYSNPRKGGRFFIEMVERFRATGAGQTEHQDHAGPGVLRDGVDGLPGEGQQALCTRPREGSIPSEGPIYGSGDQNIRFIYVGMNDQTVEIPDNCYAVGFVKDQDLLAEYYSIADVFVCTSLADTMPNVILDALACGTPVIGFDNTGIPYTAKEPLGTFVPTGDVDALCRAVSAAPVKTDALSAACRTYAMERYSPEVYYRRMQEVYQEVMRG